MSGSSAVERVVVELSRLIVKLPWLVIVFVVLVVD